MKFRSALLILVALLLVAGVAGAAPTPDDSSAASPAISSGVPATVNTQTACGSSNSSLGAAIFSPAPSSRTFLNACGACSSSTCVGAPNNQICGLRGGQYGHCVSPLGDQCTEGGWACQCWYGPLP